MEDNTAVETGKIMNRDYRLTACDHNIVIDTIIGDNISDFPLEKARFRSIWYSIGVSAACTIGYGWALHSKTVSLPNYLYDRYRSANKKETYRT